MNTKLTLSIEKTIIEKGKKYAKEKGYSLSEMIEKYLEVVTSNQSDIKVSKTPIVDSLRGRLTAPTSFNYKDELIQALSDKSLVSDKKEANKLAS
jgi:hypothetical protein